MKIKRTYFYKFRYYKKISINNKSYNLYIILFMFPKQWLYHLLK